MSFRSPRSPATVQSTARSFLLPAAARRATTHVAVVRDLQSIDRIDVSSTAGFDEVLSIDVPSDWSRKELAVVVWLQGSDRRVIGAARMPLAN